MDMKKSDIVLNKTAVETGSSVVVECDIIVPDVKPDLLKILQTDAVVALNKKEVIDGGYNVGGRVDFTVLYVPESAKGVCSLSASADFIDSENHPLTKSGMFMDAVADVEHLEFNLINSRKINIKAVVGIDTHIMEKLPLSIPIDMEGEDVMMKKERMCGLCRAVQKNDEIKLTDELTIPQGKPTIETLLKSDVALRNKEIKVIAGKIVAKGELSICSLYISEGDGMATSVENCLPFTEIIDAQGISEDNYNNIDFQVIKSSVNAIPDADGDLRMLDCDIKLGVSISSDEKVNEDIIADVYSTSKKLNINSNNIEVDTLTSNIDVSHTIKENVMPTEGIPPISHIYNVVAKPYISTGTSQYGKIMLEGVIDAYILYISSKEDSPVYNFKTEVPFSIVLDAPGALAGDKVRGKITINHISYNLNAAGEIELRMVLMVSAASFGKNTVNVISDISEEEFDQEDSPSIVLYFIQKGDTLWDIAKRYHTKEEYIRKLNNLEGEYLTEGMQILIPKA
ncbi:MAG: DUF3794 domain-containing protein [Clostridia bacterium]|nr:DUF3794 domain-containing protein [Clostridia bacterium]